MQRLPYYDRMHSRTEPPPRRERSVAERALAVVKIDFSPDHEHPSTVGLVIATVVSLVASLLIDAGLVAIGTRIFPLTKGYAHFRFSGYAQLTIVGVIIACAAWPVVTRVSSAPRWVFVRMAFAVTAVLLLPDLYLLAQGQPPRAVVVLMAMHLAIALVTYNALVHIAPVKARRRA